MKDYKHNKYLNLTLFQALPDLELSQCLEQFPVQMKLGYCSAFLDFCFKHKLITKRRPFMLYSRRLGHWQANSKAFSERKSRLFENSCFVVLFDYR